MSQPPAGWYADPTPAPGQPATQRYWDGQNWTEHVAPVVMSPAQAAPGLTSVATTPDGVPLAGWWWRALAYLIDSLIVGVASSIVTLPEQLKLQRDLATLGEQFDHLLATDAEQANLAWFFDQMLWVYQQHMLALTAPGLLIVGVYFPVMLRWKGATLGKLAVGLRVRLRDRPGQLPWSTIAVRVGVQSMATTALGALAVASGSWPAVIAALVVASVFGVLDPLWASWDPRKQALHDKIASTNVVRTR